MIQTLLFVTLLTSPPASDDRALQVADELMEALGGQQNWNEARFIRFTNFRRNRRATFTWDRWTGRLRVDARNQEGLPFVILMNLNSRQGNVYVDGHSLEGKELSEYLGRGAQMWKGATYWFLMPSKWRDPGVNLTYEGEENLGGTTYDVVHLTFDDGDDQYWGYVNRETHLMDRWKYKLGGGAEGDYQWTNWHRYGGVRVATERSGNDEVIRFEDIFVGTSMPDELFTTPNAEFP